MGCTAETSLFEAYSGKTVIPLQSETLFLGKVEVDQNPSITSQEWREQQGQDKTILEIRDLLQNKKLSQQKGHNDASVKMKTMLRHRHQFTLQMVS